MNSLTEKWRQAATVLLAAVVGSIVTFRGLRDSRYKERAKSVYQPASWVFSVVWTFIYLSYWYLWQNIVNTIDKYLDYLFYLNMILNLAWTVAFFGFFQYRIAFGIIIALAIVTAIQILWLFKLQIPETGLHIFLLLVYLSWLIVASVLNYAWV